MLIPNAGGNRIAHYSNLTWLRETQSSCLRSAALHYQFNALQLHYSTVPVNPAYLIYAVNFTSQANVRLRVNNQNVFVSYRTFNLSPSSSQICTNSYLFKGVYGVGAGFRQLNAHEQSNLLRITNSQAPAEVIIFFQSVTLLMQL